MSTKKTKNIKLWVIAGLVVVVGFFVVFPNIGSNAPTERLQLEVTSPSGRAAVTEPTLTIAGIVSNTDATVTVAGNEVSVNADGAFSHEVSLSYGTNRVAVTAEKEGLRTINRTLTIPREMRLTVDSPADNGEYSESRITVAGTVSDTAAQVRVAGIAVPVDPESGAWSVDLGLHYPLTVLNVTAELDGIAPITRLLNVNYTGAATSAL